MAIQYAPLFALETQFQTKDGRNNTGGFLKIFLAATDDPATTYSDYNGTRNPEKIILDDDGRAVVICDKSKAYRLEVYSIDGSLLWTEEPVYCSGTGGGGVSITKVVSTDGSISVDKNVAGSTTTYDLGIAPSSDEFLEWIKCSEKDCGATWYPVFNDGSMETEAGKGIKVHKGHLYHFTNSFTVDPDGTGVNYDTFHVAMYCGDDVVDERDFDIDSSLNDQVLCEFSRDVVPSEDTHVYFKLTIPSTCKVSGEVQCHRIYSGINAVPDTCATKQWVSASYQPLSGMSAYVPYSSVGNNSMGQVTGINGSAIAGGLDSASVSSIASSVASAYTESAFSSLSSKADSSALSAYQPVSAMGAYATTAYVDGMVSGKLDTTAFNSGDFYPTSNPSGYITGVDLTPYQEKSAMTAYQPSGNYYSASNPSGFITGVDLGGYATTGFVESAVSGKLDTTAFNPGDFYTTANESGFVGRAYVDSSVSGKLDTSAFASASAGFQPTGDYAFNSAVSSKLDASASGNFVMDSSMTSWIPYSALGYSGTAISGIGGSSLAGMGGGDYTGIYPVNVNNTAREIAVDSIPLVTDSSMTAYASAGSSVIGVNMNILSSKQDTLAFAYNTADQISSINGSALAGQGGATGDYYEKSSTELAYGTAATATRNSFSLGIASADYCSISIGDPTGLAGAYNPIATVGSISLGTNTARRFSVALGRKTIASGYSFAVGDTAEAMSNSFAFGWATASGRSFAMGLDVSARNDAMVFGKYNLKGDGNVSTGHSAAFVIGDGTNKTRHDLMLVTRDGEITMFSSTADTVGTGIMSSIRAISAAASGGVDSATVSAIASSYSQSAASSKLDTTAFNSGDFYSTSNPSGFITGVDLTPYQPTSAMSGYIPTSLSSDFQQVSGMSSYALSSDVSSTVDLVSTQSANWGGSALQLSAGPGVKLEKSGNVLVASTDETVLWSGACLTQGGAAVTLSEAASNFDKIEIYAIPNPSTDFEFPQCFTYKGSNTAGAYMCPFMTTALKGNFGYGRWEITNGTSFNLTDAGQTDTYPTMNYDNSYGGVVKVVGINRTAEA